MTGSTSGGPVNILLGINEFCLGTDGGGSVLGPAAAVNLTAFIGPGLLPLDQGSRSLSTDGISVEPSLGVIGKNISLVEDVFCALADREFKTTPKKSPVIAIPRFGDISLPDDTDMRKKLEVYISALAGGGCLFNEHDFSQSGNRAAALENIKEAFAKGADMVLTAEGPVDVYGYDETILASFDGALPAYLAGRGGKYHIKAANMASSPALSIPTAEAASALILCGTPGDEGAALVFRTGRLLESIIKPAPLFKRYFLDQEKKSLPFSMNAAGQMGLPGKG
jgi:Asp-tRNA(Asn)/Glu-tRNA(Gln) amidotransferase A subunit family amidase